MEDFRLTLEKTFERKGTAFKNHVISTKYSMNL